MSLGIKNDRAQIQRQVRAVAVNGPNRAKGKEVRNASDR